MRIFLADFPDASYDDFLRAFGPPEHMAAEMLRDVSLEEMRETARQERQRRRMRTVGLIVTVLCACIAAAFFYWERENNPHTISTIVYESAQHVPAQTKNGLQYGLSYQLDADGNIIAAFDKDGAPVTVDADGKPITE